MRSNNSIDDNHQGYKQTDIGLIPEDWDIALVSDAYELSKKPKNLKINPDDVIPFIPMDSISDRSDILKYYLHKKRNEISSGTYVAKYDMIISKITPSFENGKQAILNDMPNDFGFATTEVWPLHPIANKAIPEHLFNYLKIQHIRKDLSNKMEGSTGRQRLPINVIYNLKLPLPPISEQKAIAHILSTIQEAKEKTEAVIQATKELKNSMMKHLFTYGPVPVDEVDKVKLKETEIGLMPEDWQPTPIGDIIIKSQYGLSVRGEEKGKYPILRMNNLYNGIIYNSDLQYVDIDDKTFEKFKLDSGDILFNRTNSFELVGKTSIFNFKDNYVFASYLIRLQLIKGIADPDYVNYYLNYYSSQKRLKYLATRGVSQSNINAEKLKNFIIAFPSIQEQKHISSILKIIDNKIEEEINKNYALNELFKTLLNILMSGDIRINNIEFK